jgi:signal transduction histidine kinase
VSVRIQFSQGNYRIAVEDNGEGIATENIGRIFDMFYRGGTSVSGTGLGLYICKEIMEKMKGKIDVHSKLGQGTTMHLIFPQIH